MATGPEDQTTQLRRSPLHDRHTALGAKMGPFGGWTMPVEYPGGVVAEHRVVREAVGIFDVSHLGKLLVRGSGAYDHVNWCLTNDLGKIGPGQAQYTLCCQDDGGIVDDLIVYLRSDDEIFLVPNAANAAAVAALVQTEVPDSVEVLDQHEAHAVLAVQGPRSDEVLEAVGLPIGHPYMSFVVAAPTEVAEVGELSVCRTGYTGERGYELVVPAEDAEALWDALLRPRGDLEPRPCGLGARDTLRTEMGYPLHGQDISTDVTPNQARMGWAVGWKKPEFRGREALVSERESGPTRRLRGLQARGRGIPRPGMQVRSSDGEPVGEVTSGTFSPTLRTGIGLALLAASVAEGDEVAVDVRGRHEPFEVRRPPFVETSVRD